MVINNLTYNKTQYSTVASSKEMSAFRILFKVYSSMFELFQVPSMY